VGFVTHSRKINLLQNTEKNLGWAGLLMTVSTELSKYKSARKLVAPNQQANIHFCIERGMKITNLVGLFVYKRITSPVMRVEFINDRVSCMILGSCWCHIIFMNLNAPTEDKIDDVKDSFYEEPEHVLSKGFP
jgi:hypothetical protein